MLQLHVTQHVYVVTHVTNLMSISKRVWILIIFFLTQSTTDTNYESVETDTNFPNYFFQLLQTTGSNVLMSYLLFGWPMIG